ncbi:MAG TPA: hypothetical protein VES59_06585 [Bacteroidota bacterium]|nr:hypothetical protein [Bacteroidota bacterium]
MKTLRPYIVLAICALQFSKGFSQDSLRVVDKLQIYGDWFAEGIKINDEPNFGGYERIDIVKLPSKGIRTIGYQVRELIGLKIVRAQIIVNIGFPGYAVLLEYKWTDSPATPRNYYTTTEILRIIGDSLKSVWKYNTEENLLDKRKVAYLDFMGSTDGGVWSIVLLKSECRGRNFHKCKYTRETYAYKNDQYYLVKTEKAKFTE